MSYYGQQPTSQQQQSYYASNAPVNVQSNRLGQQPHGQQVQPQQV